MPVEPTFEQLYRDLEDAVRKLESGDLPLGEAVTLFERGARLAEQCNSLLDSAELRVRQLTTRPDGAVEAAPLEGWQNG
jgi:exodeoxyribonuclease VII small subunit